MASPTASGSLIADRYRVMERLGSGGMAVVYLAEDERLGRRVAVKRLHAGSPEDTAKRFSREARLGASLNHPNVVTVYDTVTDEELVVIVMEYVEGESLADAVRRGPVEPARGGRASCAASPPRSTTRTSTASSTATSSRRTSCSAGTAT